ncbi:hypothetical protein GH714_033548 [Hevea brasiliensis]|uniref:FHA domain-containing protein n=1 Tax=Hevea brasiliensis TaxID=3981 RepID=A0A6A6MQE1_HEVBR|nr:hypothetical protein GH714_033548 [Hevea brasiliensis]
MVWGLFPADPLSGEDKYYIFTKGTYKVGRKGCDVIINKDKGVSRIHAEIVVDEMTLSNAMESKSEWSSRIRIRDFSKYGTFINKNLGSMEKVQEFPNKETTLKEGDLISFGTGNATYRCTLTVTILDEMRSCCMLGARITFQLSEECTHVLVDHQMPVNKDVVDAIVAKKPVVLHSWAEYKFGDRLQSLLEVSGANVIFIEEFCSKREYNILDLNAFYDEALSSSCWLGLWRKCSMVYVIPQGSTDKSGRYSKLSSLSKVNEVDLSCAVISGHLDSSIFILPTVLVSSSCSTDETVVADSDEEVGMTSIHSTANICSEEAPKCVNKVEISTVHCLTKSEDNHVMSSMDNYGGMTAKKEKGEDPESANSDIIYSQELIIRDWHLPVTISSTTSDRILNFKRFKKKNTQSGNSFNNLIPFSKLPYKDTDYGNPEMLDYVKEEKSRKQMEAIAEDLFNNEKRAFLPSSSSHMLRETFIRESRDFRVRFQAFTSCTAWRVGEYDPVMRRRFIVTGGEAEADFFAIERSRGGYNFIWCPTESCQACGRPRCGSAVLGADGNPLKSGVKYYIVPTGPAAGALALTSREMLRPLYVVQLPTDKYENPSVGTPVTFKPYAKGEKIIRESRDLIVEFDTYMLEFYMGWSVWINT